MKDPSKLYLLFGAYEIPDCEDGELRLQDNKTTSVNCTGLLQKQTMYWSLLFDNGTEEWLATCERCKDDDPCPACKISIAGYNVTREETFSVLHLVAGEGADMDRLRLRCSKNDNLTHADCRIGLRDVVREDSNISLYLYLGGGVSVAVLGVIFALIVIQKRKGRGKQSCEISREEPPTSDHGRVDEDLQSTSSSGASTVNRKPSSRAGATTGADDNDNDDNDDDDHNVDDNDHDDNDNDPEAGEGGSQGLQDTDQVMQDTRSSLPTKRRVNFSTQTSTDSHDYSDISINSESSEERPHDLKANSVHVQESAPLLSNHPPSKGAEAADDTDDYNHIDFNSLTRDGSSRESEKRRTRGACQPYDRINLQNQTDEAKVEESHRQEENRDTEEVDDDYNTLEFSRPACEVDDPQYDHLAPL